MIRVRTAPKDLAARLAIDLAPGPTQPPVPAPLLAPEEDQAKAREILTRMAEVNRYWLFGPPPSVKNFRYQFRFAGEEPTEFKVGPNTPRSDSLAQGISYYSALHHLARDPSSVWFRRVETGDEKITLSYIFSQPVSVAMGIGVSRSWRGYFSRSDREGTLVIDAKRYVPLEQTTTKMRETWSEYAQQDAEHLAPLRIDVDRGSQSFRWNFQVHDPGLWLFHSKGDLELEDGEEPVARVEAVHINEQPAKSTDGD